MPIYAYRCESCGFEKDVLQKMSDAPLTQCPQCEKDSFRKQVTAAGFQLKGSGWYVTDFRGGSGGANGTAAAKSDATPEAKSEAKSDSAAVPASTSTPAAPAASTTSDA
ncbi:FmdB family zinc ribbon protein [Trinickia sp. NRRL B-1857]|uniref:FmdB family zinc ribbon protein n=1 Tax=Trinickia sp. NRRL B-1857 TaxID=3162879 RepID=UPI003D27D01A